MWKAETVGGHVYMAACSNGKNEVRAVKTPNMQKQTISLFSSTESLGVARTDEEL